MISVVIPTLNEEKNIGNLLKCYIKQTCKDFEIIVVDCGSEDSTQKIVKSYSKRYKNIRLYVVKKRGVALQRNTGAKVAKGPRMVFMDADVTIEKDFLEKVIEELEKRRLKASGCYVVPRTSVFTDKIFRWILNMWLFLMQFVYPHMPGHCIFSTKQIHNKLNGFDTTIKLAEDNDYVNRSRKYCKFRILKSVRVYASTRRFEEENRLLLALKYFTCPFYRLVFGEIRSNIFKYNMGKKRYK